MIYLLIIGGIILVLVIGFCALALSSAGRLATAQAQVKKGNASGQRSMGVFYYNGLPSKVKEYNIDRDYVEAARWFLKAAAQGNASAQQSIGMMCSYGEGMKKDDAVAATWYRMAGDGGDAKAQLAMGITYSKGDGLPQDWGKAYYWYCLSAKAGNKEAARMCKSIKLKLPAEQVAALEQQAKDWQPSKAIPSAEDVETITRNLQKKEKTVEEMLGEIGKIIAKDAER